MLWAAWEFNIPHLLLQTFVWIRSLIVRNVEVYHGVMKGKFNVASEEDSGRNRLGRVADLSIRDGVTVIPHSRAASRTTRCLRNGRESYSFKHTSDPI